MGQTESTHTYISSSILWYVWKCFPLSVTTQLQEPYQKTIAGRISVEIFSKSMYYLCNFQFLTLFSGKMLPHEDIGIKVPFVQLLQVCLGKGEHSDQFPWYQKHFSHHANWKNGMKPFILTVNCIPYAYYTYTLMIFLNYPIYFVSILCTLHVQDLFPIF